jgi:hypothetical protein
MLTGFGAMEEPYMLIPLTKLVSGLIPTASIEESILEVRHLVSGFMEWTG